MSLSPHTLEFRVKVAKEFLDCEASLSELSSKYGIAVSTVSRWASRYSAHGIAAFECGRPTRTYLSALKIKCVQLYNSGKMSLDDIVAEYNISDGRVLRNWISKYNSNIELKDYNPGQEGYMASARRKTTIEERKEIVEYCITHEYNYRGTAEIFKVSYNQVYFWVKKYNEVGEEGLQDKRGHHKTDEELDEMEMLRRENLRLKRKLEEKDMLVELLKKVKEFEGM